QPPRQSLKLLTLAADAMRQAGVPDPSRHVAAVRSWEMLAVAVSTRPFDEAACRRLEEFARFRGFDRVWVPGRGPAREDRFHLMLDDVLPHGFEAVLAGDGARFIRDYPFDIAPPEDDRPYFHQFIRWGRLGDVRRLLGQDSPAFVEMGSILVALTAAALAVAAVVLIMLPLSRLAWKGPASSGPRPGAPAVLGYFGAIGLGFMFLEIVWIQRFTLFWGQPLYSAAGVLAALLCGMGAGSALSAGMPCAPRAIRSALAGALALIGLLSAGLPRMMAAGLGWPEPLKWAVGLGSLFASAVVFGLPFPLALRALGASRPELVPWAWGTNGCLSVLAAPLAALTAMQGGFGAVSAVAAAAYLLAFGATFLDADAGPASGPGREG
ncbi:MAG: SAM-dependent methyltransferase, partial [Clostridiales bacterium]|nr:SAM-dependent methyltransferase [Clostridiales bacterium]